jgi:nucleoside-diphosphate kinase
MDRQELEQTLVLIKPDALKNSLTGYVLSLLSEFHTGLRFAAAKIVHVNTLLAEEHYAEHKGKVFFPSLIEYILGKLHYPNEPWKQRVIALVYQGPDAIKKIRELAGPTNPLSAREKKPGCIRSLGTLRPIRDANGAVVSEGMDNLIHASANEGDAEREIKLWFKPCDIPPLMHAYPSMICQEHYYYKAGHLYTSHESECICLLAPGETAWKSDIEAIRLIVKGAHAQCSLNTVIAKYLINEKAGE